MGPDLVLNDLSFEPVARDRDEARTRMEGLVSTLAAAVTAGAGRRFHRRPDYSALYLADGYSLTQWEFDKAVREPVRRYLQTLHGMSPMEDLNEKREQHSRTDYRLSGRVADALGTAYEVEGLAVSLQTGSHEWTSPEVTITRQRRDEGEGMGPLESLDVNHAATVKHVETHAVWIRGDRLKNATNGRLLWDLKGDLYPSLIFCDEAEVNILRLGAHYMVGHLKECFADLEEFCQGWTSGRPDFNEIPRRHSDESDSVKQNWRLQDGRECTCPDGKRRLFTYHIKLPDWWRVYIHGDAGPGKLFIGPVGKHKRTAKFR